MIHKASNKNHFTNGHGCNDNMPACGLSIIAFQKHLHKIFTDPRKVNCKNCRRTKVFIRKDLNRKKCMCPR